MIYVTQRQFSRLAKGAVVKNYPNPAIKDVNGERYEIVNSDSIKVEIEKLSEADSFWYCGKKEKGIVSIHIVGASFPVDLFVNLQKGKYGDTYNYQSEKALKFGIVESNSNTGSSTRLFYEEKLPEVLKVLKKNHFMK